jgi:hypothetical protein
VAQLPAIQWGLIAGIYEGGEHRRVVFTDDPMSIPANTVFAKGEQYFVAPGFHSMAQIWDHKEWIVWQGEKAVLDATRGHCGSCRACCITPPVFDEGDGFSKPSHRSCHNLCNNGCKIQDSKPRACRDFICLWRASQDGNRPMPPEIRPDRCGTMMTCDPDDTVRLHIDKNYPKSEALQAFIIERENEGERFEPVRFYFGEQT